MSEPMTVCGVEFKLESQLLQIWSAKTENFDESLDTDIYVELSKRHGDWTARLWHERLREYLVAVGLSPHEVLRDVVQRLHTALTDQLRWAQKYADETSGLLQMVTKGRER
jgi:hypothetical protein